MDVHGVQYAHLLGIGGIGASLWLRDVSQGRASGMDDTLTLIFWKSENLKLTAVQVIFIVDTVVTCYFNYYKSYLNRR